MIRHTWSSMTHPVWAAGLIGLLACGDEGNQPGGVGTPPPVAGTFAPVSGSPASQGTAGLIAVAGSPAAGSGGAAGSIAAGSGGARAGSGAAGAGTAGAAATAGTGVAGMSAVDAGAAGSEAAGAGGAGAGGAGGSGAGTGGGGGAGGAGPMAGAGAAGSGTTTPGNGGVVNATIVVRSGQTFDGGGKRYTAGRSLGDGSQAEGQQPIFRLEDGAKIVNVVIGAPAADGIHCHGDVSLQNIVWEDIGEDALTIKESGTVTLDGGSAANGEDKVFQINAASTFKVSNFKASNAGKFIRQNGDTTFKVAVEIDKCDISNMDEAIFRTDSSSSTVKMTNTRYSNIGDSLFIGVSPGNITQSGNMEY